MCGLAGALRFQSDGPPVTREALIAMREAMHHRGPDGEGLWIADDGRLGFSFRRLSIIDLSAAAGQPMALADGSLRIVFNGEIYNHRELRRELEGLGHRDWQTDHSDTEVILRAFRQWGIGCLDRLRGMFAIALWDEAEKALWLVRDRIGIKPLYYAIDERGLVFASEIKAILTDPARPREVDEESLFHYLSFLTTPAPRTLFRGISKLPAATWLRVSRDGRIEQRRWWDALDHAAPRPEGGDDACAGLVLEGLRRSVAYRKVADVPLGVFLSGGIDSSTNVALFQDGEEAPVRTFSIGYGADQTEVDDERPFARLMAETVGADHHEYELTQEDLLQFLPRMIWLQDEPIGDPVCVPFYFVSKLAREHGVRVCQVGEGADELFCGYPRWKAVLMLERLNRLPVPRPVKTAGVRVLEALGLGNRGYTELLRRGARGLPLFWGGAEAFTETEKRALLSPRLREAFSDLSSWDVIAPIRRRFEEKAAEPSALNWMTYLDLNFRLPELLLMRVDKMSMGVSLEARVPFLDHELVELVLGLPTAVKTRGGNLKAVLKRAVTGLVPDAILKRPKQGFSVPMRSWSFDRLGVETTEVLERFTAETDFFDTGAVARVLAEKRGPQGWYLLNFALWWQRYVAA